ncbi:MAG TPA: HNH endonuclease [Leptolyngbyaceae cyanobacterium M33_DOE_097]|uniref:HNH endonuclease n=1 Tax=Oscillatoriales cyanobacterium SpSt-418 TaxID=2282169 RepID=A0A7C3KD59_9CYAN|nr:HNH endonuclease [Leptolyngbyaceae cyanobacterium M33_DOE_097]
MKKDLNYYIKRFTQLRIDRAHGQAPYQPLLLLSLIELIEQGTITENHFPITPELISTFIKYRDRLSSVLHQANPAQPFYHMSRPNQAFWHLVSIPGHEQVLLSGGKLNTLKKLRDNILYGYFDEELFQLLLDSQARRRLTTELINKWFPDKLAQIQQLLQINSFQEFRHSLHEKGGAVYTVEELKKEDEVETFRRDATFRKEILSLYDQRCAFCRLRIISQDSENIVDGAHILPFSTFRDDRFDNGLSLCKNHHWAFDHGWFGISGDYRIILPENRIFEEPPSGTKPMIAFHGESLFLPAQKQFHPRPEAIQWHRERWNIA